MGKFLCTCGYASSNVTWPSSHEGILISDVDVDDHADYSGKKTTIPMGSTPKRRITECRECGRLWIEVAAHSEGTPTPGYIAFVPESGPLKIYGKD